MTDQQEPTRFAFYARCSTTDNQNPEESRQWQLRMAEQLAKGQGTIVAEFFDEGVSRTVPWKHRSRASALLEEIRRPDRRFDAIVIGEAARAFGSAEEFGMVFPVLTNFEVELWVPEIGGAVDPTSQIHELQMMMFGGMAKFERARMQFRVRNKMAASVEYGTTAFLGGRPPFGYGLEAIGPHPNPKKAADGKLQYRLALDDEAAVVVRRIFDSFLHRGMGIRQIAQALTDDGIPCPSRRDRERNSHRHGLAWSNRTVAEILDNPTYTGHLVWNRTSKEERLRDPDRVEDGWRTVQVRNPRDEWLWTDQPTHEPIIDLETWHEVQALRATRSKIRAKSGRKPKCPDRCYPLTGLLFCAACTKRMQGNANATGRVYYRCRFATAYADTPDHPRNINISEEQIVPGIDGWLLSLFDPENIDETCAMLAEAARTAGTFDEGQADKLRLEIRDVGREIAQYQAALCEGTDAKIVTPWINDASARRDLAQRQLTDLSRVSPMLSADDIQAVVAGMDDVPDLLREADPVKRQRLYQELGISAVYDHRDEVITVSQDAALWWGNGRVGGGT